MGPGAASGPSEIDAPRRFSAYAHPHLRGNEAGLGQTFGRSSNAQRLAMRSACDRLFHRQRRAAVNCNPRECASKKAKRTRQALLGKVAEGSAIARTPDTIT